MENAISKAYDPRSFFAIEHAVSEVRRLQSKRCFSGILISVRRLQSKTLFLRLINQRSSIAIENVSETY